MSYLISKGLLTMKKIALIAPGVMLASSLAMVPGIAAAQGIIVARNR